MKKFLSSALMISVLFIMQLQAQTNEYFESATDGATTFVSNSQSFTLTSGLAIKFLNGAGVNANTPASTSGSSTKFIDNYNRGTTVGYIKTTNSALFNVKALYYYVSSSIIGADPTTSGSITFTGKVAGTQVFTRMINSGFNAAFTNYQGFNYLDFSTGTDHSSIAIDELQITLGGAFIYVAIDNFRWNTAASAPVFTSQPPNKTICTGSFTSFSIVATGATSYKWQADSGSGFIDLTNTPPYSFVTSTILNIAAVTASLSGTAYRCVATGTGSTNSNSATLTVTEPTSTGVQTNIACNGGTTGTATVTVSSGVPPYTYSWAPSGGTSATIINASAGVYTVTYADNIGCTRTRNFTITQPPVLQTSSAWTNIACNGGTTGVAAVGVSGGTPPYTYSWASSGATTYSISGLTAGTYTVTCTDANACSKIKSITLTEPTALTAYISSQTNIACNGGATGAASLTVTGGTPGYMYNWTPGTPTGRFTASVTGLTANTFTVTYTDDNGCTGTKNVTITQPAALASTGVQTNLACNSGATGAASVTVTGGTPGYSYNWTPGNPTGDGTASVTGLAAGTVTVTYTDANGCTGTRNFTISQPGALSSGASVQTNIACNGGATGTASVTISGGTPGYTYDWTPGTPTGDGTSSITGLSAGTVTCTYTDANGCTGTRNFNLSQPAVLTSSSSIQTNIACNGGATGAASVTVTGGTPGYTYNWTPGNPTGDGTASVTGLTAGTVTVTYTDAYGCMGTKNFTIAQPTALSSSALAQANISCNGGSNGAASVSVSGGAGGYTYNWTPGNPPGDGMTTVTGLSANTFTVTYTDMNGCTGTRNFSITQPPALSSTGSQTNATCGESDGSATVAVSGGTSPYTYAWTPSGGTAATMNPAAPGNFTVTYTDLNGCTGTRSFTITENSCLPTWTGIGNWSDNPHWSSSPNGADSVIVQSGSVTVNTDVTVNDLTLESGASILVEAGNTLTVSGDLIDNGGTFTVQTGGSMIFENELKKNSETRMKTFGAIKVMSGSIRLGDD